MAGVKSLFFVTTLLASIPKVDVMKADGGKSLGACTFVPCDISNLVLATLDLIDAATTGVVTVNVLIFRKINSADHVFCVDVDGFDATSAPFYFDAAFHLASARIPSKNSGGGADLT